MKEFNVVEQKLVRSAKLVRALTLVEEYQQLVEDYVDAADRAAETDIALEAIRRQGRLEVILALLVSELHKNA
jgi:hypothetical protein